MEARNDRSRAGGRCTVSVRTERRHDEARLPRPRAGARPGTAVSRRTDRRPRPGQRRRRRRTGAQAARPVRPDHRHDHSRPRPVVAGCRPRRRPRRGQGAGCRLDVGAVAHGTSCHPQVLRRPARESAIETKVNYPMVGLFVLVLGAALIAGVLWLASGGSFQRKYDLYLAIEDESVAGLNLYAPVKYSGVDVGKVREIRLDPGNPQRVYLLFAIERGTPVKEDTVAVLKTQGLTGIAYVELSGGARDSPPLRVTAASEYPVIRTKPSLSARLENVLTTVLAKLDSASSNINAILSDENRAALKSALADIASVPHPIAARKDTLDTGIANAARTFENASRATAQAGPMIDRIGRSADAVEKMGNELARTSASAGKTVDSVGADAKRFTAETLPELERLLGELSVLTTSLRRLSEQTERDPRGFLFGRRPVPEGPGEPTTRP